MKFEYRLLSDCDQYQFLFRFLFLFASKPSLDLQAGYGSAHQILTHDSC